MLRVTEIIEKSPYYLLCKFNNGAVKRLDVLPIIENHKHLNGVESLLNEAVFNQVRIGEFGEIMWEKVVKISHNGEVVCWDYDISPEFAFENAL